MGPDGRTLSLEFCYPQWEGAAGGRGTTTFVFSPFRGGRSQVDGCRVGAEGATPQLGKTRPFFKPKEISKGRREAEKSCTKDAKCGIEPRRGTVVIKATFGLLVGIGAPATVAGAGSHTSPDRGRLAYATFSPSCSRAGAAVGWVSRLRNYVRISFGHRLLARRFHLGQLSEKCRDSP